MYNGTLGVKFGDYHSLNDWHLGWTAVTIDFPEPKTYTQDIPAGDGSIDLTDFLIPNDVKYKQRNISFTFESIDDDFISWSGLLTKIANAIHGRKIRIVLDTDPQYFYYGRMSIDSTKTDKGESTITLSGSVEPYKYEQYSSLEDWLWDSFSFENGIIREYKDLAVDGTLELTIYGRRKHIVPIFTCSAEMKVTLGNGVYTLPKGASKVFDIKIVEGENTLTFTGNGTVSIDYRGGSL